jgi:hypothetical protein
MPSAVVHCKPVVNFADADPLNECGSGFVAPDEAADCLARVL